MFLHCLRCNVGLGHEAEFLPHDAYMTDDGPLCDGCVAILLNAALPMRDVLNEAAAHIESIVDNGDDTGLRLYVADINALDMRARQMRRAIALAEREGAPSLAETAGIDTSVCELCEEPLGDGSTWKRGLDGAAAHIDCLRNRGVRA